MRKLIFPISLGFVCTSFTMSPAVQTLNRIDDAITVSTSDNIRFSPLTADAATTLYNSIQLEQLGLSKAAFDYAWKGYEYLLNNNKISRSNYLTICDFSQSSLKKRLYIIDIENNRLVTQTYVAHGRNSGGEYASQFSNKPESLQSSLGFYVTANTYIGKHGLSLKIDGMEPGINDKAMERTIVIHGADYVSAGRAAAGGYMGRSWGCPAVPRQEANSIIETIKNGTCLFIYHPEKSYLHGSKILNG